MDNKHETKSLNVAYLQYQNKMSQAESDKKKLEDFKKRISEFKTIRSLKEAKSFLDKNMPVSREITIFHVGEAKCTVLNKKNILKISLDTPTEFICYEFI